MSQQIIVVNEASGPGCLVRVLWFVLVGWWLGLIVSGVAWLLVITIILLPLGLMMINKLPAVMTLKPASQRVQVVEQGDTMVVSQVEEQQRSFLVRALYFVFVGWWFCGLWMATAYTFVILLVTIPIAFWMYDRVPAVTTLRRY